MTDTIISSATKEIVIGFDRPFVIIGERINPTGRKIMAAEMMAGDYSRVIADALAQVEAGAHMLDVNAGIPLADEPGMLAKAIQLVQGVTDVPLSIDSSIVAALEAGLAVYKGKALVNSVTGEEDRLETVLPLVKNMAPQWLLFPTTRPVFHKTPMCGLPWRRKLSNVPLTSAFLPAILWLTPW